MDMKNNFPGAGFMTEVVFASDGLRLKGVLHSPSRGSSPPPAVIGSHGLLSDGDSPKQVELARRCNQAGIAYFRFDHRGCGKSEGVFREVTSLEGRRRDLISAAEAILARPDIGGKLGLFGSSMGGATCLSAAETLGAGPLVVVAAPIRSSSIFQASPELTGPDGAPPPYDAEKLRFDLSDRLPGLANILIFHGDADEVVPAANAHEIFAEAGEPKRLAIQENGDHRMSDPGHQERFILDAVKWFGPGFGVR